MVRRLKEIALSPYFHSFLIATGIIAFLPDFFSRYVIEPKNSGSTAGVQEIIYFCDLDRDDTSERIASFLSSDSIHAIQIFGSDSGLIDQWNIHGRIPGSAKRIHFADFNRDGITEVFAFALKNDSLILSCFNPFKVNEYIVHERFIARIPHDDRPIDFEVSDILCADFNHDQSEELVFTLNNCTFYQPRVVCIFDIAADSLRLSQTTGIAFKSLKTVDLDNDGNPEITGGNESSGNHLKGDSTPFTNYSAWVVSYDGKFNFRFNPVEFPGIHSEIMTELYPAENPNQILVYYNHTGSESNEPFAGVYDISGKPAQKAFLPDQSKTERCLFRAGNNDDRYFVAGRNGFIYQLTGEFNFSKVAELGVDIHTKPMVVYDFDRNGKQEIVFKCSDNENAVITGSDFKYPVKFLLPQGSERAYPDSWQIKKKGNASAELFIQNGKVWQTYSYRFNFLYYLKYPVYLLIYLLTTGGVLLLRYMQRLQIKEKQALQSRIAELQLQSVNHQIDPHFTFNAFSSIATLLKKEKGESAYTYFMQFTDLIRLSLLSTDKIFRTLEEEISVVKNYLDLQKLRFGDRFSYEIHISPEIDLNRMIPKMIIQTFTENAVKHGFKETKTGGLLTIGIMKKNGLMEITVQDNGMGREKAGSYERTSTGIGLAAMDKYIALLNRQNDLKIEKEITDLYDDKGKAAGTRIVIKIP